MIYKSFRDYISGILSKYGGNVEKMVVDQTTTLFNVAFKSDGIESSRIKSQDAAYHNGKFMLIRYNYNGNDIWCPVFNLEYRVIDGKTILYAVQLEYIPPLIKFQLFSSILDMTGARDTLNSNNDKSSIVDESPVPITPEAMYNILKSNGLNYSLTGFDSSKVTDAYLLSTKVIPSILSCDCKRYNIKSMRQLLAAKKPDDKYTIKLKAIIEQYQAIVDAYKHDSLEYHKKVRGYEKSLKLYED